MADVFLSYSREDQPVARVYAETLEREGFSVWWDTALNPGETFDQITEQALKAARAVVVLWSKRAVESRWVRSEATQADRYGTLAPVTIEPCNRPIMFELTQTTDLSSWKGDPNDPVWRLFIASLRRMVERGATETTAGLATARMPAVRAHRSRRPLWIAAGVAVALLVGTGLLWMLRGKEDAAPVAGTAAPVNANATATRTLSVTSVAVMPFANLTGDPEKEFFGDGMAEELINALAKVNGLRVASRTSSFAYKGKDTDLRQIARELGVATVIEGSVRSAGDRVRLTAQLINADSGYHLWSETYDRDFKDLFQLQDELTREIVAAYRRTLGVDQLGFKPQNPPTTNLDAYVLYLRGQHAMGLNTDAGAQEAIALADQAVALDPKFAGAHRTLALAHSLLPGSPLAEVEKHARVASELNDDIGRELLVSVAARRGDWVKAEEIYQALGDGTRGNLHATSTLWPAGRIRDAISSVHASEAATPGVPVFANNLARLYSSQGRTAEALRWNTATVERGADPAARRVRQVHYDLAVQAARYDDAADIMVEFVPPALRSQETEATIRLVHEAMEEASKRAAAIASLDALVKRLTRADWTFKVFALSWYSQLGALDEAYEVAEALRVQFEKESGLGAWAWMWTPQMSALRSDARFQPFMTRVGMMAYWEKYGPPDSCNLANGKLTCT